MTVKQGGRILSNYYAILNVAPASDRRTIRAAYLALISKYHPDTWQGDRADAERYSKLINEAYSVLRNDLSRAAYDLSFSRRKTVGPVRGREYVGTTNRAVSHVPLGRFTTALLVLCVGVAALALSYPRFREPLPSIPFDSATNMGLGSAGSRPADLGSRGAYVIDSAADRLPSREAENSPRLWPGVAHGRSPDLYEDAVRQDMSRRFGVVNDEDEFTIQLSCSWATAKGSVEYQACVSHYLDEILAGANYPAVAPTDDYQTTMAQLACEPLRLEGPAVYNGCLHKYLGGEGEVRETRMGIGTESGRAAVSHPDR